MATLDIIRRKILAPEQVANWVSLQRFLSKRIVFTNGCFDILHLGHVDYLARAADEGDVLVIGLNTDESTRRLKGPHRPINDEVQRAMLLASMHFVDAVIFFGEDTPLELIRKVMPDVLVKGADYSLENIVGADLVLASGGQVKT
ncbi:MAG TPA: adenylyltransferase/cytidyltransferase family protein, partial [Bacteroidia bacterium]|nr:adenylyltransferase/cytidyltransferase family protein [Bacteroidia bacterium]